jgi:hypothetical protein
MQHRIIRVSLLGMAAGFGLCCGLSCNGASTPSRDGQRYGSAPTRNGHRYDPIEDDPKIQVQLKAADEEADQELAQKGVKNKAGSCHVFWEPKKRILREKYGIDWRTPAEMNPEITFD